MENVRYSKDSAGIKNEIEIKCCMYFVYINLNVEKSKNS